MTAKLCATMRVNIHVTYSSNVDSIVYTEVTLPDKFVGCDYIETVSCCSTSGNQSGTIVFANSYCYAGCTSTMLMTRSGGDLQQIAMKLSTDGSIFMYNSRHSSGFTDYIMVLGYKFQ